MIEDFCKLNKTPYLLGRTSRRILWCWLLLFCLTGGFYVSELLFHATGTPHWLLRPVKASTSSELYTLATFGCFPFARFWEVVFYPQAVFTLHPFPTFWHVFVTQMRTGTPHLGSYSVPVLTELSILADAWSWTTYIVDARPLVYQLRQWAWKYGVTKLPNMFQPTYACPKSNEKTIKIFWTRLLNKYCLKLLQRNCFFKYTSKLIWKSSPRGFFYSNIYTLHLNVKNLQSPGNLNWYIRKTKNGLKI